jgi:hypothetical protein
MCPKCREKYREYQHEKKKENLLSGICTWCGKNKILKGRICCETCILKASSLKYFRTASRWQELLNLFNNQKGVCPYTEIKLIIGRNASIDHIIPKSRGGQYGDIKNMQWVDDSVNFMKNNLLHNEFIYACSVIAKRFKGAIQKFDIQKLMVKRKFPSKHTEDTHKSKKKVREEEYTNKRLEMGKPYITKEERDDRDRKITNDYTKGMTHLEIARKYNISVERVRGIVGEIINTEYKSYKNKNSQKRKNGRRNEFISKILPLCKKIGRIPSSEEAIKLGISVPMLTELRPVLISKYEIKTKRELKKEKMLLYLKELFVQINKIPSGWDIYKHSSEYHSVSYIRYFGSLKNAWILANNKKAREEYFKQKRKNTHRL